MSFSTVYYGIRTRRLQFFWGFSGWDFPSSDVPVCQIWLSFGLRAGLLDHLHQHFSSLGRIAYLRQKGDAGATHNERILVVGVHVLNDFGREVRKRVGLAAIIIGCGYPMSERSR